MQPEYTGFVNFGIFFFTFLLAISALLFISTILNKVEGKTGGQILKSLFIGLGTALCLVGVQSLSQRAGLADELNRNLSYIVTALINLCLIFVVFQVKWKKAALLWLLPLAGIIAGWIYLQYL